MAILVTKTTVLKIVPARISIEGVNMDSGDGRIVLTAVGRDESDKSAQPVQTGEKAVYLSDLVGHKWKSGITTEQVMGAFVELFEEQFLPDFAEENTNPPQ